jgi:cytochrome c oxidase subunit 1
MAFPRLNMASYWFFFLGGVTMLASFFVPGGAAQSGWTSYSPLANIASSGQTWWLVGMIFLITSSLLGAVNFITTTIQLRTRGLTFFRFPFFVWAQFVTAFLLLLAFPPLEAAAVMQLMDRVAGTSFFLPSGLVVSGQVLDVAGGGNALPGSTCSGSWRTRRSTFSSCRPWGSSPRSSRTTRGSRCGATARWSTR